MLENKQANDDKLENDNSLNLDDLENVSGGSFRDSIVTTDTTDVSDDTKKKI